jgi:hypothetical protein
VKERHIDRCFVVARKKSEDDIIFLLENEHSQQTRSLGVTKQLMTFDEVNTRIDQPMEHDIHRGI